MTMLKKGATALAALLALCIGVYGAVPAQAKSIILGFSQIGAESEWRTANTNSVKKAAQDAGIDLVFSDAQQKQENQIKALRSFIAQEVDIIALTPIVETGWDTVLLEAKDAGIPVMIMDRDAKLSSDDLYVCKIGTDSVEEGRKAFRWIDEHMVTSKAKPRDGGAKYNVLILEGTVGSSAAVGRAKGWNEALDASANKAKFNLLASQTGEFTRAKGKEVMESFLKSYKNQVDIVFAHNDDMGLGAIQAIEDAGLKPGKDIVIIAIDATKGGFQAMIDGKLNCLVECNPLQGALLMETAKKILDKKPVARQVYVEEGVFPAEVAKQVLPSRQY